MKQETREEIQSMIEQQQRNEQEDNPKSTCAAWHRGYIAALEWVLSLENGV